MKKIIKLCLLATFAFAIIPAYAQTTASSTYTITSDRGSGVIYLKIGEKIKFTAEIGKNTAGWNGTYELDILGANTESLQCEQTYYTDTQAVRVCTATQNAGNTSDSKMAVYARGNYTTPLSNIITVVISSTTSTTLQCQSPYVEYLGKCVDPIPPCRKPIVNSTSCIDKIENGQYIDHYKFTCLTGYQQTADQCIGSTTTVCQSPYVEYLGKCVDPIPACRKPIVNSTSCIDKIENGQYIDHYKFSCLPGYQQTADQCVGSTTTACQSPYVEYLGKCVDPIPACGKWPTYAIACIDKIENGQYIERYYFQCKEGYVRSGDYCVLKDNFQPTVTSTTPIPAAGYEDEVITNPENYQNPFPDTNTAYIEGKAAAELFRRGVLGGFPDGEFKGSREVNRAEAAKFLLLAKLETVSDLANSGKFPDVMEGQWYVKFVMKAAELGIINGYPDGYFRPQNTVNTAEFLKMLAKTFGLEENLAYSYSDVNSSDWFARYAGIAQKYNLFPNRSIKLEPGKNLTRDEVAVAIYQYLKNR